MNTRMVRSPLETATSWSDTTLNGYEAATGVAVSSTGAPFVVGTTPGSMFGTNAGLGDTVLVKYTP